MAGTDLSRRKFLISSAAGVGGLVIAQSTLAGSVTNLLDPGSPLMLPENLHRVFGSLCKAVAKRLCTYLAGTRSTSTAFAQMIAEELAGLVKGQY